MGSAYTSVYCYFLDINTYECVLHDIKENYANIDLRVDYFMVWKCVEEMLFMNNCSTIRYIHHFI